MNDICIHDRNRLKQKNLDTIIKIVKEGKDQFSDVDLERLVDIFRDQHKRKLEF